MSNLSEARFLRERDRHEQAVTSVLGHLAHHPQDPAAFLELALNRIEIPGQLNQALEDARTATGLIPSDPFPLSLQSRILTRLDRHREALTLAESAIALDPDFGYSWISKCLALVGMSRWKEAEDCARTALGLDADDETASNLLAHVLRMQNRLDESEEEAKRRLARDPENAFSFANAGWAALQRGDIKGAESYFKESLRIEPNMEYARSGLKASYQARSAFFRLFLKWSFFIQRFSDGNRVVILIGLVVGFRILRSLAASVHPLLVIPLALAYYLFVFGSWLSSGLANFFLLKDPMARMSLDPAEKLEGLAMGVLFFGGFIGLVAGMVFKVYPLAICGGVMMLVALPASMVFTNPSFMGRAIFGLTAVASLTTGALLAIDISMMPDPDFMELTKTGKFSALVILIAGSTWLGMVPSLRQNKPA